MFSRVTTQSPRMTNLPSNRMGSGQPLFAYKIITDIFQDF